MRIALGLYTELTASSPVPAFRRALSVIYKPVLSYLYNNPGLKMSLYQSTAMMKYIDNSSPEMNLLISSLAKRQDLELITGSYSQTIISLNPPKDRSYQIEKMTTLIRRYYGVRATSSFFYGQIWSPLYVHALKAAGISSVVISAYKATGRERISTSSFVMNELGKRVRIHVASDDAASLVSHFAQGIIGFDEMYEGIHHILETTSDDVVLFLNADQLIQGSVRAACEERTGELFISILQRYGQEIISLSQMEVTRPGYLDAGWYGRDAWSCGLRSFNDLFVRNENYRYLFNRFISLSEQIVGYKKDKALKRDVEAELFHMSLGPLFIHDAQCTPLRLSERKLYWKAIIESEKRFFDQDPQALFREYDLEEIGQNDYIARNKVYSAVFSPKGGGVAEFCYKPALMNMIDTRPMFDRAFPYVPFLKSFTDIINGDENIFDGREMLYDASVISKTRGEYQFSASDGPISIVKLFKLRAQTLVMETAITTSEDIDGRYVVPVYLAIPEMFLQSPDQRKLMLLSLLEDVRTVRYTDSASGLLMSFSSTEGFSLTESKVKQSQYTSLGLESFDLYTELMFSFPLKLRAGEAHSFRFIARVGDINTKDKE